MLKLMIADDELYVIEYMKTLLDWESLGISLCGFANDSEEALQIAEREEPDLALLDINMPGMDGLQLTELLKQRFPELVMAFVTGYSEFEYARKALQLGAEEYILKPFSREELENAVLRLKMKIEKRRQERYETKENKKILRENLLRQLLLSPDFLDFRMQEEKMQSLGIQFPYRCCLAAQVELLFKEKTKESDWALWRFSVRNILEEYKPDSDAAIFVIEGEEKRLYLVWNGERESLAKERLRKYFGKIQDIVWELLGFPITVGIGEVKEDLRELYDSRHEALEAVLEQKRYGAGKVYFYEEIQEKRQKPQSRRATEIIRAVEDAVRENYQDSGLNVEKIAEKVYLDASYIRRVFSRYRGQTVVDYLTDYRMEKAKELLEKGELPISQIAEQVGYLDPGYFTKCFKKRYGVTPSNYPVFSHS